MDVCSIYLFIYYYYYYYIYIYIYIFFFFFFFFFFFWGGGYFDYVRSQAGKNCLIPPPPGPILHAHMSNAVYTTTRVCLYHPATRMWLYPKPGILDTATLTYKAIQPHTHEFSCVINYALSATKCTFIVLFMKIIIILNIFYLVLL